MHRMFMFAPVLFCIALVLGLNAATFAASSIEVGHHSLLPDTPNQGIGIFIVSDPIAGVAGLDMYVQVGDGGATFSGVDTGPIISSIDIVTGTIFASNNTGQSDDTVTPLAWALGTTTSNNTVLASGLLATVYLDTTGMFSGTFDLLLTNVGGAFDTRLLISSTEALDLVITNGSITVIPEPGVAGLLACGALLTLCRRFRYYWSIHEERP